MVDKDQNSRPLKRPFAPGTRPKPEDALKVHIVKDEAYEPRYNVGKDTETDRPIVTKKEQE